MDNLSDNGESDALALDRFLLKTWEYFKDLLKVFFFDANTCIRNEKLKRVVCWDASNLDFFPGFLSHIVNSIGNEVGEDLVEVEAKLTGEENEIAFNARYLIDILSVLSEEELIFEMTGPLNPGVFKIKEDNSFLHLIMPIRVQA